MNDTSWNVEEQYFNSTISVADKGMQLTLGAHTAITKVTFICVTTYQPVYVCVHQHQIHIYSETLLEVDEGASVLFHVTFRSNFATV